MGLDIAGLGSVADLAKTIWNTFAPDKPATAEQLAVIESAIASRDQAKKDIIVAELNQEDVFTKRARPMIIYIGLGCIVANYVVFPQIAFFSSLLASKAIEIPLIVMPDEFWMAWGGVCSLYVLGRSAEKGSAGGVVGKIAGLITGKK